jgi:hypothetical protein
MGGERTLGSWTRIDALSPGSSAALRCCKKTVPTLIEIKDYSGEGVARERMGS